MELHYTGFQTLFDRVDAYRPNSAAQEQIVDSCNNWKCKEIFLNAKRWRRIWAESSLTDFISAC